MVNRIITEVDAQREEINRNSGEAGRAINMMYDRRFLVKATEFSIPESHLTDMHALVNEREH